MESVKRSTCGAKQTLLILLILALRSNAEDSSNQYSPLSHPQTAFVTLVSTEDFILPAMVLAHSIRRAGTTRSLVCMVVRQLAEPSLRRLSLMFDRIVEIENYPFSGQTSPDGPYGPPHVSVFFLNKLRVLEFIEYQRVVYIGSDAIAVAPLDQLFSCSPPCAVADIALWEMTELGVTVNGDVLVLEPSMKDANAMMNHASHYTYLMERTHLLVPVYCKPWEPRNETYIGPLDQALLNQYYRHHFTILPYIFNFMPYILSPELGLASSRGWLWDERTVKVIHYARLKPWRDEDMARIEGLRPTGARSTSTATNT
eukprot:tig00000037_g10081.t1